MDYSFLSKILNKRSEDNLAANPYYMAAQQFQQIKPNYSEVPWYEALAAGLTTGGLAGFSTTMAKNQADAQREAEVAKALNTFEGIGPDSTYDQIRNMNGVDSEMALNLHMQNQLDEKTRADKIADAIELKKATAGIDNQYRTPTAYSSVLDAESAKALIPYIGEERANSLIGKPLAYVGQIAGLEKAKWKKDTSEEYLQVSKDNAATGKMKATLDVLSKSPYLSIPDGQGGVSKKLTFVDGTADPTLKREAYSKILSPGNAIIQNLNEMEDLIESGADETIFGNEAEMMKRFSFLQTGNIRKLLNLGARLEGREVAILESGSPISLIDSPTKWLSATARQVDNKTLVKDLKRMFENGMEARLNGLGFFSQGAVDSGAYDTIQQNALMLMRESGYSDDEIALTPGPVQGTAVLPPTIPDEDIDNKKTVEEGAMTRAQALALYPPEEIPLLEADGWIID